MCTVSLKSGEETSTLAVGNARSIPLDMFLFLWTLVGILLDAAVF